MPTIGRISSLLVPAVVLAFATSSVSGCHRESVEDYLAAGDSAMQANKLADAEHQYSEAAKAAPNDPEPYFQAGLAYLNSNDPRSAAAAFHRCLELNPRHAGAQLKSAELMAASRNPDLAKTAATRLHDLLQNAPDNAEASEALALTEWQLGNAGDAMTRLENVLHRLPASLSSSVMLARIKLSNRDLAGAEHVLHAAAHAAPDSSAGRRCLPWVHRCCAARARACAASPFVVRDDGTCESVCAS